MTGEGSDASLVVEELRVQYQRGAQPAIDGVTFRLAPGEGLLLAGERGSGKSSVLRALAGLVRFAGHVSVGGAFPGTPGASARVGYAPQGKSFPDRLTPREIVRLVAQLRGGAVPAGVVDDALDGAGVPAERRRSPTADVEVARRVALACALVGAPDVLLLDDPWEFPETEAAIAAVRARGGTVLAASHDPGNLPALLGRTLTLVDGRSA